MNMKIHSIFIPDIHAYVFLPEFYYDYLYRKFIHLSLAKIQYNMAERVQLRIRATVLIPRVC